MRSHPRSRRPGRPESDDDDEDGATAEPMTKRRRDRGRRTFKSSWKVLLPWLVCIPICPSQRRRRLPWRLGVSPAPSWVRLLRSHVALLNEVKVTRSRGGWVYKRRMQITPWHRDKNPRDLNPDQTEISERLAKQLADESSKLKMMCETLLAKEKIALAKRPRCARRRLRLPWWPTRTTPAVAWPRRGQRPTPSPAYASGGVELAGGVNFKALWDN